MRISDQMFRNPDGVTIVTGTPLQMIKAGFLAAPLPRVPTRSFSRSAPPLADPLIDLKLFRFPTVRAALVVNILAFNTCFAASLFIAQYQQSVLGLSPLAAGGPHAGCARDPLPVPVPPPPLPGPDPRIRKIVADVLALVNRAGDPIILRTREISNCFSMQRTLEATNSGARHLTSRERNRLYVTHMIVKRT